MHMHKFQNACQNHNQDLDFKLIFNDKIGDSNLRTSSRTVQAGNRLHGILKSSSCSRSKSSTSRNQFEN